jgi:hypothetical protein
MPEGQDEKNIFIETLEWICNKLDLANIPYMITGGSALGFWGHIRTTMEIDIVIQINEETIDSFLKSIENDAYVDFQKAKEAVFKRRIFNIIFSKTCFKIDLISLKEDVYEREKFKNRIKMKFQNSEIFVISPEDLIISKLYWNKSVGGSERQIKDCESIYRLNHENLDLNYIEKWVRMLKVKDEFDKLL